MRNAVTSFRCLLATKSNVFNGASRLIAREEHSQVALGLSFSFPSGEIGSLDELGEARLSTGSVDRDEHN